MVKWELYRQRVDQIDDEYAVFKRSQKRINWWLFLILRHLATKKVVAVFQAHLAEVRREQLEQWAASRIAGFFRGCIARLGPEDLRARQPLRQVFTFQHLAARHRPDRVAKTSLRLFLGNTA